MTPKQLWYHKNREKHNEKTKENYRKVRQGVLEAYGSKCACCGESTPEFLGIDHIYNDGAYDRRVLKMSGYTMYRFLKNNDYPKDRYQLLCHNCNQAKGYYKQCPHQKERAEEEL